MTTHEQPRVRHAPAIALSLAFISLGTTAWGDPRRPPNIPSAERNSPAVSSLAGSAPAAPELEPAADTSTELPLPYTAWHGSGFAPPKAAPASDLPAPLARPREQARRPFELSAALSAFLPSCGSGSIDDRACLTLGAGSGLELAVLYRATPFFAFGAEAALSGFGRGRGVVSNSGGSARFLGATGRVYFADAGAWDPYVALTLGVGTLDLRGADDGQVSTTGLGARVAGGVDYHAGSHWRIGPSASFSRWFAYADSSCQHGICRDGGALYGHVLGFATLGLRLSGSWGDAL